MGNQVSDKSFYVFVAGLISAIFVSSFWRLGFSFFLFLMLVSLVLLAYRKYFLIDISKAQKILLFIIFIFSFGLGVLRYEIKDLPKIDKTLESSIGQKVSVIGIVAEEPGIKENNQELIVDFKTIYSSTNVFGRGLISTNFYPEFKYGDLVRIEGKLEKPENILKEDGREFDYISHLAKDDIKYKISFAKVSLIYSGNGNFLKSFLFKIKNAFSTNVEKVVSEPQASLLGGILLGSKSAMSKDVQNSFQVSGLSHIVALSGYNISIVAAAIMNGLSFLPRAISFAGGAVGIILFVIMSGASSTAVRAGIMSLILILAGVSHRKYLIGRALILAGVVMIIINPKILVFDISFQLSFLATIAIVYVSPLISPKLKFVTEKFGLRETLSGTLSAQLLVLPLILYKIGMFSFVAIPANLLVLLVIPITMFFGFITGIAGFFGIIFSYPFAWISWALLTYIIKVSEFFAILPFSHIILPVFPVLILFLFYVLIFLFVLYLKKTTK